MSAARVEKLEALLARVAQRAALPRPASGVVAAAAAAPAAQYAAHAAPVVTSAAAPAVAVPPMRPLAGSAPELTVEETDDYMDTDVEVSTEVVEVDVDEGEEQAIHDDAVAASGAHGEHHAEEEERAPVSSRRPVALQEEEEHDEYAENPPRHTPPPESGRQVAAAASPVPPLASERRPSAPPMQEPPQVGGWREPGLEAPRTPSVVPPPAHLQPPPRPVAAPPTSPQSSSPAISLTVTAAGAGSPIAGGPPGGPAQVMRPEIKPNAEVAKIEGEIAAAEESSFGDLLDSSLSI